MTMEINLVNRDKYEMRFGPDACMQVSPLAMNWIDNYLLEIEETRPAKILEFGSGYSTLWYGMYHPTAIVDSVEGDEAWYETTQKLLTDHGVTNVRHHFVGQNANYRDMSIPINPLYWESCLAMNPPYDFIINDGAEREMVGDFILENADGLLAPGGFYLRHDYEKLVRGQWYGRHLKVRPSWVQDAVKPGYDGFCVAHPAYTCITIPGNGKWGYRCEFGGIWRIS